MIAVGVRVFVFPLLCALATGSRTVGNEVADAPADAQEVLRQFGRNQDWTAKFSMKVRTEYGAGQPGGRVQYFAVFELARDGKLMSVAGEYDFFGTGEPYRVRSVAGQEIAIDYRAALKEPPKQAAIRSDPGQHLNECLFSVHYGMVLDGYLEGTDYRRVNELVDEAGLASYPAEDIGGHQCHVVGCNTSHGSLRVWFDPDHGYAIRKCAFEQRPNDLGRNGKPLSEQRYQGEKLAGASLTLEGVELARIGDRWIPVTGQLTISYHLRNDRRIAHSMKYTRTAVDLQPSFSGGNVLAFDIPNGTTVAYVNEPERGLNLKWMDGRVIVAGEDFAGSANGEWFGRSRVLPAFFLGANVIAVLFLGYFWLRRKFRTT